MSGVLTLVPTPIASNLPLEPVALRKLQEDSMKESVEILVEELKTARRMWSRFELPREAFEKFVEFNEHTQEDLGIEIVKKLQSGKDVYLLSDCGLPAFCDPGQKLVELCYQYNIKVTSTPFPNSIALAISLSGLDCNEFHFAGFVSNKKEHRTSDIKKIANSSMTTIVMDTPYRFNKLFEEFLQYCPDREVFLGTNLNCSDELCLRGTFSSLSKKIEKYKCEFIMILGPVK